MPDFQHKVAVVGTGYVGLTTGACLAHMGHQVTCIDVDEEKIREIESGRLPIYEVGLLDLVIEGRQSGRLKFETGLIDGIGDAEFIFLCLPTPQGDNGAADLSAIESVAGQLRECLRPGVIVINKSTVPVKSANLVKNLIGVDGIDVVSNPEFLREGSAVQDFLNPDRIVIGCQDERAGERVASLYLRSRCPVLITDPISAESIKYMANAFLALKISFVNQAASYCDAVGADILEVMKGLSFDPRIGNTFLTPGPGWGGSCFPKDTRALSASAKSVGSQMTLIEEAVTSNSRHINQIVDLISNELSLVEEECPRLCVLGLTFKANTDDVRESPSIEILSRLEKSGSTVICYDPMAKLSTSDLFLRAKSIDEAMNGADVVVILTEWDEFKSLSPNEASRLMRGRTIIDARYVLDVSKFGDYGISVKSLGRRR